MSNPKTPPNFHFKFQKQSPSQLKERSTEMKFEKLEKLRKSAAAAKGQPQVSCRTPAATEQTPNRSPTTPFLCKRTPLTTLQNYPPTFWQKQSPSQLKERSTTWTFVSNTQLRTSQLCPKNTKSLSFQKTFNKYPLLNFSPTSLRGIVRTAADCQWKKCGVMFIRTASVSAELFSTCATLHTFISNLEHQQKDLN